jgi:pSer/pThr/pTyr-binding forkhead associated (FHA) protein
MIAIIALALRIALAVTLYYFLGRALLILWRELRQQTGVLISQIPPGINLDLVTGDGQTTPNRFTKKELLIGRDRNCDLAATDESISARHAHLTFHHGQWWIEDLSSTNGTFLNDEKLNIPTVLTTGDELKCGNTIFRVRMESGDDRPSAG